MKLDFPYIIKTVRRSRHLRLIIHRDGRVVVTKPYFLSKSVAESFLFSKAEWVKEKLEKFKSLPAPLIAPRNREDYLKNKEAARNLVRDRLKYFNDFYNFKYQAISIRDQATRWGSCSKKGNLNFNYRLITLPADLCDYIIVHELCHLKEFNHSPRFWNLVARTVPGYQEMRKRLKGGVM
jgi:hypothetical protein